MFNRIYGADPLPRRVYVFVRAVNCLGRMMIIAALLTLTLYALARADSVTLAWDANEPAAEGYRIFMRAEGTTYDYTAPAWQGTGTTCTIADLSPGATYAFVARAFQGGNESGDSNEVVYTIPEPTQTIVYPKQPKSLIIRFGE